MNYFDGDQFFQCGLVSFILGGSIVGSATMTHKARHESMHDIMGAGVFGAILGAACGYITFFLFPFVAIGCSAAGIVTVVPRNKKPNEASSDE